ncbi:hypothetical protein ACVIVC_000959 [Sinorhizobium meliloti]
MAFQRPLYAIERPLRRPFMATSGNGAESRAFPTIDTENSHAQSKI